MSQYFRANITVPTGTMTDKEVEDAIIDGLTRHCVRQYREAVGRPQGWPNARTLQEFQRVEVSSVPRFSPVELDRETFHGTYNGGYTHEGMEKELRAFHHGMDTVFNALEKEA